MAAPLPEREHVGLGAGLQERDLQGRNVVERFLNYLKQWRGLATRYDKYAHIYRGGVTLGAILCWLSSQR